jgi:UDP-N-acetylmuramate-alanine ligase
MNPNGLTAAFVCTGRRCAPLAINLNMPGAHNALNATAAVTGLCEGLLDADIKRT